MAQKIEIVRGTSNPIAITVTDATLAPYTLGAGEKIIFGVKKNAEDTDLLIAMTASLVGSEYVVFLAPEDTEDLPCSRYVYDVGLQSGENFYNIIEASPFIIRPNITSRGCV